ncbi:hypothetical protein ROSA5918_23790 [Roseateles saccharophilus]
MAACAARAAAAAARGPGGGHALARRCPDKAGGQCRAAASDQRLARIRQRWQRAPHHTQCAWRPGHDRPAGEPARHLQLGQLQHRRGQLGHLRHGAVGVERAQPHPRRQPEPDLRQPEGHQRRRDRPLQPQRHPVRRRRAGQCGQPHRDDTEPARRRLQERFLGQRAGRRPGLLLPLRQRELGGPVLEQLRAGRARRATHERRGRAHLPVRQAGEQRRQHQFARRPGGAGRRRRGLSAPAHGRHALCLRGQPQCAVGARPAGGPGPGRPRGGGRRQRRQPGGRRRLVAARQRHAGGHGREPVGPRQRHHQRVAERLHPAAGPGRCHGPRRQHRQPRLQARPAERQSRARQRQPHGDPGRRQRRGRQAADLRRQLDLRHIAAAAQRRQHHAGERGPGGGAGRTGVDTRHRHAGLRRRTRQDRPLPARRRAGADRRGRGHRPLGHHRHHAQRRPLLRHDRTAGQQRPGGRAAAKERPALPQQGHAGCARQLAHPRQPGGLPQRAAAQRQRAVVGGRRAQPAGRRGRADGQRRIGERLGRPHQLHRCRRQPHRADGQHRQDLQPQRRAQGPALHRRRQRLQQRQRLGPQRRLGGLRAALARPGRSRLCGRQRRRFALRARPQRRAGRHAAGQHHGRPAAGQRGRRARDAGPAGAGHELPRLCVQRHRLPRGRAGLSQHHREAGLAERLNVGRPVRLRQRAGPRQRLAVGRLSGAAGGQRLRQHRHQHGGRPGAAVGGRAAHAAEARQPRAELAEGSGRAGQLGAPARRQPHRADAADRRRDGRQRRDAGCLRRLGQRPARRCRLQRRHGGRQHHAQFAAQRDRSGRRCPRRLGRSTGGHRRHGARRPRRQHHPERRPAEPAGRFPRPVAAAPSRDRRGRPARLLEHPWWQPEPDGSLRGHRQFLDGPVGQRRRRGPDAGRPQAVDRLLRHGRLLQIHAGWPACAGGGGGRDDRTQRRAVVAGASDPRHAQRRARRQGLCRRRPSGQPAAADGEPGPAFERSRRRPGRRQTQRGRRQPLRPAAHGQPRAVGRHQHLFRRPGPRAGRADRADRRRPPQRRQPGTPIPLARRRQPTGRCRYPATHAHQRRLAARACARRRLGQLVHRQRLALQLDLAGWQRHRRERQFRPARCLAAEPGRQRDAAPDGQQRGRQHQLQRQRPDAAGRHAARRQRRRVERGRPGERGTAER